MQPSWWDRKKHEWLYHQEIRRQQRLARKYAKLQAKEQRLAEREMSDGAPGLSQLYQEWSRKRRLKKEQQAEELALSGADLPWLKRHETKFFWAFALCVMAVFAVFITKEVKKSEQLANKEMEKKRTLASINGKPIYVETVLDRLFFAHGAAMLQELSEQEVIRQLAEKHQLELTADELSKIEALLKEDPQRRVREPRLRHSFLLRKLVLRDVTEERKKQVYKDFKEDVTSYVVSSISFADKAKANEFLEALNSGIEMKEAALQHSVNAIPPQKLGGFTPARLNKLLGGSAERAIRRLKPGQMSPPLFFSGTYVVYRLDDIKTEYTDVQDAIETLIVEAEAPQFMYEAISKAEIDSPFIDPELSDFKEDMPGPFETPSPSPTPEVSAAPGDGATVE